MDDSIHYTVREIAEYLSATVVGDSDLTITGIASLACAQHNQLSFLANKAHSAQLANTRAGAVILSADNAPRYKGSAIIVDDPYLSYARLTLLFDRSERAEPGIDPTAVIGNNVTLGDNIAIGPNVVIGANATIADDVIIGAGSVVGKGTRIGARTRLSANVTLYHDLTVGEDCLLHSGCVIGADGFGFAPDKVSGQWCKIYQLGGVRIGNNVEIGASTCIDRGALEDTLIGDGVIIDNQVHVAHNCRIGENTAIAANCGIAGSTTIGRNCTLAGAVGLVGHIELTDNVHVTGMSMVTKSIDEPGSYSSGSSAITTREWRKNAVRFNQLNELALRIKKLESQLKS